MRRNSMVASTDSGRPLRTEPASCPDSSTSWSVVKKLRQLYVSRSSDMWSDQPFRVACNTRYNNGVSSQPAHEDPHTWTPGFTFRKQ